MDPKKVAQDIDAGRKIERLVEEGSSFGSALAEALAELGWKPATRYSVMSKATFQTALERHNRRVVITSAVLFGPFTQIEVVR